jgi:aspartyl-tRNA(Asn)/glutamyl-tRNA(Gln) amidotransferase subunit C
MAKLKLTKSEIKHVAQLAKLKLSEAEVEKFSAQLSEILEYFRILNRAATGKVEPTSQVTGLRNIKREDKSGPSLTPKEVLSGVSAQHNNLFKIKAIFK